MANEQKYSIQGIIRGVAHTEGKGTKGTWKRAAISIEKADGSFKATISTFNEPDIKIANSANGQEVKATFTKSPDGKYNNLVDGGLAVVGQGEAPITEEEVVEDPGVPIEMTEEVGKKLGQQTIPATASNTPPSTTYKSTYETPEERTRKQLLIVRQSSQKLALDYAKLCLEAVEKGILTKEEFTKEDLNFEKIMKIAKMAEKEVMEK